VVAVRESASITDRAVDADDQRPRVLHGDPERLDRLAREVAAAAVDRREGDPERQLGDGLARRRDRGLGVERVEDRLDQEQVDTAVAQGDHLLRVSLDHVLEAHGAVGRVLDLRRERERHVQRPDGARDEAVEFVGHLAREPRALEIHVANRRLERVVGLADARRGEGVRGRDVGAGLEVGAVHALDDLRPREVEQVGVALHVARVVAEPLAAPLLLGQAAVLEQDAPRAVEDGDPLGEKCFQSVARVLQAVCSLPKGLESGARGLFRRLVTRSPKLPSKLSGTV
jgi:hypothetical protein